MRIIFVTNPHDPDSLIPLRALVDKGYDVVAVVTPSERRRHKGFIGVIRSMVSQYGLRGFAEKAAQVAAFAIAQRFNRNAIGVESYACQKGIPLHRPRRLDSDEFFSQLQTFSPDLILVAFCSQILTKKVIDLPQIGCLNIHRSLLPRYRGAQAIFWVIFNNETETGASVHWIVEEIDAGDVMAQKRVPIFPWDVEKDVAMRAAGAGAEAAIEALEKIRNGEKTGHKLKLEEGSYFPRPDARQLQLYRRMISERAKKRAARVRAGKPLDRET